MKHPIDSRPSSPPSAPVAIETTLFGHIIWEPGMTDEQTRERIRAVVALVESQHPKT